MSLLQVWYNSEGTANHEFINFL